VSTVPARPAQPDATSQFATLCDAFQATACVDPKAVALRNLDGSIEFTWREYARRVRTIAAGLAVSGVRRGDTVALMLTNRPEFHLCDTAVFHLGATPFSIYNTSAPEQIAYLCANAGNRVVIAERQFLDRVRAACGDRAEPHLLVSVDGPGDEAVTLEQLEALAEPGFDFERAWREVQPDDVLTLIYTSGTTGPPKGVEITHANMLAQWSATSSVLPLQRGDRITSYLPAAHIGDRCFSHYSSAIFGVQITSIADLKNVGSALPELRPTVWGAVPRVLEKLKAGLESAITAEPNGRLRDELQDAIELGIAKVRLEQAGKAIPHDLAVAHRHADHAVLSRLRAKLGLDEARWIATAAAPLSREVHEFLLGLGLPVTEIYGMSECSCVVTGSSPSDARVGAVGRALPGIDVTLAADGELLVRGATIMRGYRGEPEKTADTIDSGGWLHTGDIATIDGDGYVRIVDRKKELIINAAGKNMSPANIENELKASSPLIGQVAVIGDSRPYNVALIVLDPDAAAAFATAHGLEEGAIDAIVQDPRARTIVERAVAAANARLSRAEQIKRYVLLSEDWPAGGDELTPTMKLRRKPISEKYAAVIERLYDNSAAETGLDPARTGWSGPGVAE
jgi:long-subunit acyl-CoA synthetase (AMP-forming)